VAAHGRRQVERRRADWRERERELQLHAWPSVRLRARGGVADWVRDRHGCVSGSSGGSGGWFGSNATAGSAVQVLVVWCCYPLNWTEIGCSVVFNLSFQFYFGFI
jgi:hypothetical protein